jgi:glutathione S-transferase
MCSCSDIAVAFSCEYVLVKKIGLKGKEDSFPKIKAWLRHIEARPAYQETLEKGAKHDFCLLQQDAKM